MAAPGTRLAVAVSGGPDSVLLLEILVELRERLDLELSVVHLNHLLRGVDSNQDEEFTRRLAQRHQLDFHLRQEDVLQAGGNLEEDARNARMRFFRELMESKKVDRVATAHTRSDQAETVLFRLLRGAYLGGIAGILPVTPGGLVRPMIDVDREDVIGELTSRHMAWREDSSNRDPRFARNRIRHEVLPWLEREWNPELSRGLATFASLALDDENYWTEYIENEARDVLQFQGNSVLLAASELKRRPRAVTRRLIRYAMSLIRGDRRQIDFRHVEAVMDMAHGTDGHGRVMVPGVDVMRSFDWVRFAPPEAGERDEARQFTGRAVIPSQVKLPGGGTIAIEVLDSTSLKDELSDGVTVVADLDWDKVAGIGPVETLELRTWQPGDEYRPAGRGDRVKVKQLFQDERVPLWERASWPILTLAGQIVWTGRFGASSEVGRTDGTRRVLRIGWKQTA